jgi:predicted transcriptional regulator
MTRRKATVASVLRRRRVRPRTVRRLLRRLTKKS